MIQQVVSTKIAEAMALKPKVGGHKVLMYARPLDDSVYSDQTLKLMFISLAGCTGIGYRYHPK